MRVLSIGEVLWDVFPDGERLGGAPLNFAVNLQRFGEESTLLSAVGNDERGQLARARIKDLGLSDKDIQTSASLPTGVAMITLTVNGFHEFSIPRPAAFDDIHPTPEISDLLRKDQIDWIYFGTLLQTNEAAEEVVRVLFELSPKVHCFYDMNLREGHWNLELVQRLANLSTILKANEEEAMVLHRLLHGPDADFSLQAFCEEWTRRFRIDVICVTRGAQGCFVYQEGRSSDIPSYDITVCDTVGAGDAFSAAFLHAYRSGQSAAESARYANGLGALIASRAGATPDWSVSELERLIGGEA